MFPLFLQCRAEIIDPKPVMAFEKVLKKVLGKIKNKKIASLRLSKKWMSNDTMCTQQQHKVSEQIICKTTGYFQM